jgi:hypothetical protein
MGVLQHRDPYLVIAFNSARPVRLRLAIGVLFSGPLTTVERGAQAHG